VSAPTGSIELYLSDAEHGDLSILREYTTGEKITQKISINGQEMLQGKAQEKINEYMGGSSIRKLSPYKFMNMSPKEKLALISEILHPVKANAWPTRLSYLCAWAPRSLQHCEIWPREDCR
jgi:hypothetical protein